MCPVTNSQGRGTITCPPPTHTQIIGPNSWGLQCGSLALLMGLDQSKSAIGGQGSHIPKSHSEVVDEKLGQWSGQADASTTGA